MFSSDLQAKVRSVNGKHHYKKKDFWYLLKYLGASDVFSNNVYLLEKYKWDEEVIHTFFRAYTYQHDCRIVHRLFKKLLEN